MMSFSDLFGRREDQAPVSPEENFSRVDEDLMNAAKVLKPLLKTEGYKLLVSLIQDRRREIATMALEDETMTKDWWKGFHAGAGSLEEIIGHVARHALAAEEERGVDREALERMPTSGGDFSV